jgi:hypothetical protein
MQACNIITLKICELYSSNHHKAIENNTKKGAKFSLCHFNITVLQPPPEGRCNLIRPTFTAWPHSVRHLSLTTFSKLRSCVQLPLRAWIFICIFSVCVSLYRKWHIGPHSLEYSTEEDTFTTAETYSKMEYTYFYMKSLPLCLTHSPW